MSMMRTAFSPSRRDLYFAGSSTSERALIGAQENKAVVGESQSKNLKLSEKWELRVSPL